MKSEIIPTDTGMLETVDVVKKQGSLEPFGAATVGRKGIRVVSG